MDNPFQRRATEFLRDDEAFLAIVSPEPVTFYLTKSGQAGRLYDRLVVIRGTPGSGKTTLARLFEYPTLTALWRNSSLSTYQALASALAECGVVSENQPRFLGCRLPLETDYREFWEFPYSDGLKSGLMSALIQARAVLAWMRHLAGAGIDVRQVQVIPRLGTESILDAIGGASGDQLAARAREVEKALYQVTGSLIAPREKDLPPEATGAYQPFDVIETFRIETDSNGGRKATDLRPLAMLDDAHVLQPAQFEALQRWLARRELRIARWIISRLDVLPPREALDAVTRDQSGESTYPGLSQDRETEVVLLQSGGPRRENRTNFRRMAKDMAGRYLRRMPILNGRNLVVLADLLNDEQPSITASESKRLADSVDSVQRRLQISTSRREAYRGQVEDFRAEGKPVNGDVALGMLAIMLHRHEKRRGPQSLLEDDQDPELSRPVTANSSVYDAALLQLMHKFDRPYFFGIDDLCDASSENAEQFLQLAAVLVETAATQIIRAKAPSLTSETQHRLLRKRGAQIVERWNFPQHLLVRRLVTRMAERCAQTTVSPNGWLTPNAFGVLQSKIGELSTSSRDLGNVLKFAVAYNAVTLVPHYPCKGKEWCLIELGGCVVLQHGLTLKRGGFIESSVAELADMLQEPRP